MKIAINTRFLQAGPIEGVGNVTQQYCQRLIRNHPDWEFHLFYDRKPSRPRLSGQNVTDHILIPQARHPILWRIWFDITLPHLLRKVKPDVFLSPDGFMTTRGNCPSIMITHDLIPYHYPQFLRSEHRRFYKKFIPRFHQCADHIVAVSEATRQDIIRSFGTPASKVTTIWNGADEDLHPLKDLQEKKKLRDRYAKGYPYFLFLGALSPRKNVEQLIKAYLQFSNNSNQKFKLVIVGRMAWKTTALQRLIRDAGDRIIHYSHLDRPICISLIQAAHAICYVSKSEGFGFPILEGFSCEIPVITSNVSSMPEVAGNAALLVDPEDTRSIAKALSDIAFDQALCQKLIAKGNIQKEKFNWDKSTFKLEQIIKSVAHQ